MKTFIVASSMFLLLMFFPVQYVVQFQNSNLRTNTDIVVNKYVQEARVTGYFTNDMISRLKKELAIKTNRLESEIVVNVTKTPKYRRTEFEPQEFIEYDIRVPIPRILAMASYFQINSVDNKTVYSRIGKTASEVLPS